MTELNTTSKKIGFSSNIVSFVSLVGFFILLLPMPDGSIYGYGTIFFALLSISKVTRVQLHNFSFFSLFLLFVILHNLTEK